MSDSNDIKIAVLQTKMENIEKKIEEGFMSITKTMEDHIKYIDGKIDLIDKNKSNKWVERVVAWGGSVIGAIIIGAIMSQIIK